MRSAVVRFSDPGIRRPDVGGCEIGRGRHSQLRLCCLDVASNTFHRRRQIRVQNEREHPAVSHCTCVLTADKSEHSVADIFTEIRARSYSIWNPNIQPLTFQTKVDSVRRHEWLERDIRASQFVSRGGFENHVLWLNMKQERLPIRRVLHSGAEAVGDTVLKLVPRWSRKRLPRSDHQSKNVGHLTVDQIDPVGRRSKVYHASSRGGCMRIVPAISSA